MTGGTPSAIRACSWLTVLMHEDRHAARYVNGPPKVVRKVLNDGFGKSLDLTVLAFLRQR